MACYGFVARGWSPRTSPGGDASWRIVLPCRWHWVMGVRWRERALRSTLVLWLQFSHEGRSAHQVRPPDVVQISEVDKPAAKDNEVLVKVYATTVNRTDAGLRAAQPFINRFFTGLRRPRVTVLGNEFAGEVEAVGRGVTSFAVGDRVFGYNGTRFGAHAGYLAMPEDGSLATMPANLTYQEAAVSTEGSHYALSMIRKTKIRRGQDVLVNGATGAIGSAAVQLLKHLGAEVTAVCGTEHVELVRGLGADRVIDYTAEDFTRDTQTYDVVLDAVGKSSFGRCKRLLKPRGIPLLGPGSAVPESDLGAHHAASSWQEGHVSHSEG
jgi:NADPH:quinone reductase-like Zn-dependent oxidoreductase